MKIKFFKEKDCRAAKVFNFMKGLDVSCSNPINSSENSNSVQDEFDENKISSKTFPTTKKKILMADAGLIINTPYPVILRPERMCDIIISYDFYGREKDDMMPFEDLLQAERWAKLHKIPFPPIDPSIYEKEGLKEMYIFKDERNPNCPVIIHFCLCNVMYRKFNKPGILRKEEDEEGDFDIFSKDSPWTTLGQYKTSDFEKLHDLMKFNTAVSKQRILEVIADCIKKRRRCINANNDVTLHVNDVKRKIFVEKFGEAQALLSFDPEKVDIIRKS